MTKKTHTTINDLLAVLRLLAESEKPLSQREIAKRLKLSTASITRLLATARKEYRMVIVRPQVPGDRYKIESWGLLNPFEILDQALTRPTSTPRKAK
jgi:DNA-binding transcriptional regulator LsrR (DeoR family)